MHCCKEDGLKRRDLIKMLGLGVAGIACRGTDALATAVIGGSGQCVVIPRETAGPFGVNLSDREAFFRTDISEGRPGLPLDLTLRVTNANDGCSPIANARVDVWHCDRDGVYSGFAGQPGGVDARGETFCRGILLTDDEGFVRFKTIYPGWYPGRVTHIHFQVFLSSGLVATSQLAFPDAINAIVYASEAYPRGANGRRPTNLSDFLFASPAGALDYQVAATSPVAETGGYHARLDVGVAV